MKIVLDVPALERLLGGDTELEIELRKNVANEFANRHLSVLAKQVFAETEVIKEAVKQQVFEELGITQRTKWGPYSLSERTRDLVRDAVHSSIYQEVQTFSESLHAELKQRIAIHVRELYDREVMHQIKAKVQADIIQAFSGK